VVPVFQRFVAVSDWLRTACLEPVFARPLSPRALRVIIIAAPFLVLISQGTLWTLLGLWGFAAWLLPTLYHEVLRSRALHQEMSARAWAAESSLRQAAGQRWHLERELQKRLDLEREIQKVSEALRESQEELGNVSNELQDCEDELQRERHRKKPDPTAGTPNPLFRRVGLDEKCPDFVLKAVRTAYRRALHPDTQPEARKAEATRRFQDSEAAFDEIYGLRGLQR
jgi:septal ring factor EnvC (AmiA/AmiB activator)